MKKLLVGLMALSSISALAFDCTKLKDFSSSDLDLALKLAESHAIEQINNNNDKDVSSKIKLERNLLIDLANCKVQAIDAKIEDLQRRLRD